MWKTLLVVMIVGAIACGDSTNNGNNDGGNGDAAPTCPDMDGKYSITTSGAGCGVISSAVPICITQIKACTISVTTGSSGSNAVSGTIDIGVDGSISGATVQESSATRTGCTGAWDSATSTLTIDCGGTGTSQSCHVSLVRTGPSCGI